MIHKVVYYFLIIVAGTAGELCVARTMKVIGEVEFCPAALASLIFRAIRVGWMWAGIGLMTLAFFALLGMLSIDNVSLVVPVTALSYTVGTLGGKLFLGERISGRRWTGVAIVSLGVALVLVGNR
jgi:drug/metabolite transporter (DMT)-like permease